jgi:thiosulfate dehydrogenase (quinone)
MNKTAALITQGKGLILTPLRVSMGWLLFSAFWRRVVLKPEALQVLSPEYVGIKFNHFIPSSLGIEPMIKYLVLHPELLYVFLWVFTIIEGIVGIGLILGLFTRFVSLVSTLLLCGVMLGAGWLGTTCVDEWQIGIFGISAGIVLFLGGGGSISLDHYLTKNKAAFRNSRFCQFLSSGPFFEKPHSQKKHTLVLGLTIAVIAFTLITNQANVGGVWGPFKNPAIKPHISLSHLYLHRNGDLKMRIYRNAGPDTYGAFVVAVQVIDKNGRKVLRFDSNYLGNLSTNKIQNFYMVKVKPNKRSLLVPLGGLADIELSPFTYQDLKPGTYQVELIGIDNEVWSAPVEVS